MPDREKVIRAMMYCVGDIKGVDENDECRGDICPYKVYADVDGYSYCQDHMIRDALALLKEQEARVLEYSEIEKHPLVWIEDNGKEDVIPALFLQYNGCNVEFALQAPDEWVDMIVRCATAITFEEMYGTTWRAWTSRPSPEQMRETEWEGENCAE